MNATDEPQWPDDFISSADIEEMKYRATKVLAEVGQPVAIELALSRDQAKNFIRAARTAHIHPGAHQAILGWARQVASMVKAKLEGP